MVLYVGLDVSLEETHFCVLDPAGKRLKEGKAPTDPAAVAEVLSPFKGELDRVGLEASSIACWLAAELKEMGFPAVVVEARQMRAALNAQRNKTDRNDARGIAEMIRLGWYRAVHVKSPDSQRLRLLLSNRRLLKRKLIDVENHLRGTLRAFGLFMGTVSRGQFEGRVRQLLEGIGDGRNDFIETMLAVRQGMLDGYNALHRLLVRIVAQDPVCRRLMTVPGVGPITALSFKSGVDDPLRFRRSRTVGAHFGLTPRRWQSGSIDIEGHITKQGDREVRTALCEAAASLLLRVRSWSALKAWGMRIAKRTSMMNAIVAVARKLAAILHRVWLDDADFKVGRGAKMKRRLPQLAAPAA
ncbi:IS110 family transposase [Mesorhizobium sp. WSM4976]|uniref:IS110 family transposase n=1 Tax=Mesorhizobium sp. WSM4976 TaxID=3038549 RepID=UPI002415EB6C|nr:IS110 family transposase [Mesorhizobium sp. WSM4976]MDG4898620.1 IS110 family transposase [Mesorhizobium sp. WSM4976]